VTDEWIAIFKQLWSQSPASFDGRFYQYTDIRCEPFPVQKPHPPIWVGGHSRAALRRKDLSGVNAASIDAARLGFDWFPTAQDVRDSLADRLPRHSLVENKAW